MLRPSHGPLLAVRHPTCSSCSSWRPGPSTRGTSAARRHPQRRARRARRRSHARGPSCTTVVHEVATALRARRQSRSAPPSARTRRPPARSGSTRRRDRNGHGRAGHRTNRRRVPLRPLAWLALVRPPPARPRCGSGSTTSRLGLGLVALEGKDSASRPNRRSSAATTPCGIRAASAAAASTTTTVGRKLMQPADGGRHRHHRASTEPVERRHRRTATRQARRLAADIAAKTAATAARRGRGRARRPSRPATVRTWLALGVGHRRVAGHARRQEGDHRPHRLARRPRAAPPTRRVVTLGPIGRGR